MPGAMEVTREPDFGPRPVREQGSLLVLALLAFAAGGTSGLLGAVFRLVLSGPIASGARSSIGRTARRLLASCSSSAFRPSPLDWPPGSSGNSHQEQRGAASRTSRRCCVTSNRRRP